MAGLRLRLFPKKIAHMKLHEVTDVVFKNDNKTKAVEKEIPLNDPSGWNVMIMNNNVTPAQVVVEALMAAVKISAGEAMKRMMAAHKNGWVAVAAYGSKDMADTVASKIEMHAQQNKNYEMARQFNKHKGPWPLDTEVMKAGE